MDSKDIEQHIRAFRKCGGKITRVPRGVSGEIPDQVLNRKQRAARTHRELVVKGRTAL